MAILVLAVQARAEHLAAGTAHYDKGPFAAPWFKPRGIHVAADGRVFVVDMSGRISRFSPEGELELRWSLPEQGSGTPTSLFVDSAARVLIADTHNSRVLVYDDAGHQLGRFGRRGTGGGEFLLPTGIVADSEGCIYVSEYGGNDRISKFNSRYEYLGSFGDSSSGTAALAAPYGLCLDDAETIWVADSGNHRVCRFDRSGNLLATVGGLGRGIGEMRYPHDVAWVSGPDGAGLAAQPRLLVCEKANYRLQIFSADGKAFGVWGEPGRSEAQFNHPTGVAVDHAGRVLVADSDNNRICVVPLKTVLRGAGLTGAALAAGEANGDGDPAEGN